IQIIGQGAFGEVQLVRHKVTQELFALKKLSKKEMLSKTDEAQFWSELNVMATSDSPWIVQLHYAFQDKDFLFMAMEFVAGGDLISLIDEIGPFQEDMARFYAAELILALDDLHKMGYAHRDVKPENLLLDQRGHLKLADFGSCARIGKDGLVMAGTMPVGTPEYISPEVLNSQQGQTYGPECDWWTAGLFLYELLTGECLFYDEALTKMYSNISNHDPDSLEAPEDIELSPEALDLLKQLICPREKRLGAGPGGVADIKAHPFFKVLWENLRTQAPPYIPEISSPEDAANFPEFDTPKKSEALPTARDFAGNQLPFVGFSFQRKLLI
ncbi:uncharacterized protein MONBRDRAFT_1270, partial [Monosiga brevicollis MX1]